MEPTFCPENDSGLLRGFDLLRSGWVRLPLNFGSGRPTTPMPFTDPSTHGSMGSDFQGTPLGISERESIRFNAAGLLRGHATEGAVEGPWIALSRYKLEKHKR